MIRMLKVMLRYMGVLTGVIITALGLDMFLVPNKIAAGGVSGAATIVHHLIGVPVGLMMLSIDIPLFVFAALRLGLGFGLRSLVGSVLLALSVDLLAPHLPVPTDNLFLASIYGGVLVGLGLGLVFRCGATTGGTDLIAALIRSYTNMNIGQLLFLVDGAVVVAAGLAFQSWELAMYALISIFITARVIDTVQQGVSYARAFIIITTKPEEVANGILQHMSRGVTTWQAEGAYTGGRRQVLLSVVNRSEITRLKEIVHQVDQGAFVISADVHEVLGEGFKPINPKHG